MIIGLEEITENLLRSGVCRGDVLLLSADLGNIGLVGSTRAGESRRNVIKTLLDFVGPDGTIVTVTFTKSFLFHYNFDKSYVFTPNTPSTAGGLARGFLEHPNVVRSTHPTCSFAAIGKMAKHILLGHNAEASAYDPIGKVIELNGKVMLVGCADYKNGLHVVHYAQQVLGLSKQNILSRKIGVQYSENGAVKLFKQVDLGGCSRGFYKFYGDFVANNILSVGHVGKAYSVLAPAQQAFEIVLDRLKEDPTYALCHNKDCFSCRGCWKYNKREWPAFYGYHAWKKIFSKRNIDETN